eukprot:9761695-Alexandrium_andersonii.AAC.1
MHEQTCRRHVQNTYAGQSCIGTPPRCGTRVCTNKAWACAAYPHSPAERSSVRSLLSRVGTALGSLGPGVRLQQDRLSEL